MKRIRASFGEAGTAYEALSAIRRHCISADIASGVNDSFDIGGYDPVYGFRPTPDMAIFGSWFPINFAANVSGYNPHAPQEASGIAQLEIEVTDSKYDTVYDILRQHRADLIV